MRQIGPQQRPNAYAHCLCDCGQSKYILKSNLRAGRAQSCGCLQRERTRAHHQTHGGSHTRAYTVWQDIRSKCSDPNYKSYPAFGGRMVKLCPEWHDFPTFWAWAEESGLGGGKTVVLIDRNGDFTPDNSRVAESRPRRSHT
jgi:hypothetical protein